MIKISLPSKQKMFHADRSYWYYVINDDIVLWLKDNFGTSVNSIYLFNQMSFCKWYFEANVDKNTYDFFFKDIKDAVLFKLTWCHDDL